MGSCMNARPDPLSRPEKIDYMAALTDSDAFEPDFGGVVEEVHTCPGCGNIGTRRVVVKEE